MSQSQMLRAGSLKFSMDWITRPFFGLALALAAIVIIFAGTLPFAIFMWLVALGCAREWHRMVGGKSYLPELAFSLLIFTGSLTLLLNAFWPWAFMVLAVGAIVHLIISLVRGGHFWWQAGGVLYIGIPLLSVVALRAYTDAGAWVVIGVFIIVWATDTGALFAGNLIGGPKIAPVLSPNKTWAGTVGGLAAAGIVEAVYVGVLGGSIVSGILFGVAVGLTAHGGDFFESWAKRKFQLKDIGTLIPGHGGVLDRIDSSLSSVTAVAIAVFLFGLNTLFGAHV